MASAGGGGGGGGNSGGILGVAPLLSRPAGRGNTGGGNGGRSVSWSRAIVRVAEMPLRVTR